LLEHLPDFTKLAQHWPQLKADFEGVLKRSITLWQ
jgi:hypothetical protein